MGSAYARTLKLKAEHREKQAAKAAKEKAAEAKATTENSPVPEDENEPPAVP
jgi:hypothetical protein